MDVKEIHKGIIKIIPVFTLSAVATSNQPAGGVAKFSSAEAADTQQITVYGTRTGMGSTIYYEISALKGANVVTTTTTDWEIILGAFLGDPFGTISSLTAGNVTITDTGGSTIYTLTAGTWSIGSFPFYLSGQNLMFENLTGNTYIASGVQADPNGASFYLSGKCSFSLKVDQYLSMISDSSGSTAHIMCLEG